MASNLDAVAEEGQLPVIEAPPSPTVTFTTMEVDTGKFGKIKVHIQGDINEKDKKAVFLTVHDIGTNHNSFRDFIEQPCMCEIKSRSIFIHIDLPGQEENAPDLPYDFSYPTIQQMGEELIPTVLNSLKVNLVICIGDGAGANILVRFALANPSRTLGMVLIHLVTAGVGVFEKLKDSISTGKRRPSEAIQTPEHFITLHKIGEGNERRESVSPIMTDWRKRMENINMNNVRKYTVAYMNRKDISDKVAQIKTLDVLLVAGSKSQYLQGVINIHGKMDKSHTSLLKIDACRDVMLEAPDKLAQSLLCFAKGLGCLTSLLLPGIDRQRTFSGEGQPGDGSQQDKASLGAVGRRRTLSMEDYDLPRQRRLSLTNQAPAVSPSN